MPRWLPLALALLGACAPDASSSSLAVAPDAGLPPLAATDQVDLLFLVDDSCSMCEEQASFTAAMPRLMRMLLTGDLDDDGRPERAPLDVQVGVVTTDMGTGGYTVPTCARSDFGDDGILTTRGRTDIAGCRETYLGVLRPTDGDDEAFAQDLACVATVGTGGCGFEQPLEAILKALTPSASPVRFVNDSAGHGDGTSAGLVRPGSVLAVVALTDEEDCSALDPAIFDTESDVYAEDLNLRCLAHPGAIHPVSRYVEGLLALRRDPRRLVYLPIAGIPSDLAPAPGATPDWERLVSEDPAIRDDRMENRIDPYMPSRTIPSCNVPGRGVAFPPVRLVELARQLDAAGSQASVASVCLQSYDDAMTSLAQLIGQAVAGD